MQLKALHHFHIGYKETQISTLDCLADLVRHYIQAVSANTLEVSEISGRVHPGIQDVMSIFGDTVIFALVAGDDYHTPFKN
jgi:Bromodomain associated